MCETKSTCCALSPEKSATYVPVIGDVICEGPGVIYVSIDPDVWRIRCQQCQQKTEHKCPLKKLKRKFKKEKKLTDSDDDLTVKGKGLKDDESDEEEESEDLDEDAEKIDEECTCPERPGSKKPKPKVCWCPAYVPVNFLLEVEVTGEQKSEVKKKKQRNEKRNSIVQPVTD